MLAELSFLTSGIPRNVLKTEVAKLTLYGLHNNETDLASTTSSGIQTLVNHGLVKNEAKPDSSLCLCLGFLCEFGRILM